MLKVWSISVKSPAFKILFPSFTTRMYCTTFSFLFDCFSNFALRDTSFLSASNRVCERDRESFLRSILRRCTTGTRFGDYPQSIISLPASSTDFLISTNPRRHIGCWASRIFAALAFPMSNFSKANLFASFYLPSSAISVLRRLRALKIGFEELR